MVGDHVVRLVEEAVAVVDLGGGEGEGSGLVTDHVKGKLTLNHVDRLVEARVGLCEGSVGSCEGAVKGL